MSWGQFMLTLSGRAGPVAFDGSVLYGVCWVMILSHRPFHPVDHTAIGRLCTS